MSAASGMGRSTARAPVNSMLARVVSKCVLVGTTWPGLHITVNRMRSAARPWWRGNHVAEAGELVDHALEAEEALAAGVGFVAAHHRRPLFGGHGAGAGIGEQIDQDVAGVDEEQVVAGLLRGSASRSSGVVWRSGSTLLMRKGSMIVRTSTLFHLARRRIRMNGAPWRHRSSPAASVPRLVRGGFPAAVRSGRRSEPRACRAAPVCGRAPHIPASSFPCRRRPGSRCHRLRIPRSAPCPTSSGRPDEEPGMR